MKRKLVAGNWKMNKTVVEAAAAVETFSRKVDRFRDVDVVICPPFLAIPKVRELIKHTHIDVGAQDVFWMESGAFTGQISASMLHGVAVKYCIVGHSETRGRFGKLEIPSELVSFFSETDRTVRLKIRALLECDIKPILCVGETLSEREANETDAVIAAQLTEALTGFTPIELEGLVVAYEPVWAIGTGKTCDTVEANRVCGMVRAHVQSILEDAEPGSGEINFRVLYGGSVKAANARELFSQPNIDGGLVGGASLDPNEFTEIVAAAE